MAFDIIPYTAVTAILVSGTALRMSWLADKRSKLAFLASRAPRIVVRTDPETNPLSYPIEVVSEDPEDLDTVTVELITPEPDTDGAGFGERPPTTASSTTAAPLRSGKTVRLPAPLSMAVPDVQGFVQIKVTMRRGSDVWQDLRLLQVPTSLKDSFG